MGGPVNLRGSVSGDLQGRANSVSWVDGVSDMAPTCQFLALCGGRGGEKNPKREGTHRLRRDMRRQLNIICELVCQLEVKI